MESRINLSAPEHPGGVEAQKARLEAEGHAILSKGRTNVRYYLEGYENVLADLA